jgi:hypothetical protein
VFPVRRMAAAILRAVSAAILGGALFSHRSPVNGFVSATRAHSSRVRAQQDGSPALAGWSGWRLRMASAVRSANCVTRLSSLQVPGQNSGQ